MKETAAQLAAPSHTEHTETTTPNVTTTSRQVHSRQQASPENTQDSDLVTMLIAEGIAPGRAKTLVHSYPADRILRQVGWLDSRRYQNRVATLVAAIERDFEAPAVRRAAATAAPFDQSKYYRGSFALCSHCGSRPCLCSARQQIPASQAR